MPGTASAFAPPVCQVVALHGLASGGITWRPLLQPLAEAGSARVWLPDLLGFCASPWPAEARYDVDDHVQALDAWAEGALDPAAPLVIAGCSLGAVIAAEWALRLPPECVHHLVLVCVPLFESAATAADYFSRSDPLTWLTVRRPRLAEAVCRRTCGPHGLMTRAARLAAPGGWMPGQRGWRAFPAPMFLHSWESLSRTLRHCLLEHRAQPALRALAARGTPITLIHGERDRLAPIGAARDFAAKLGARFVSVPGGTHAIQLTHGAVIRAEIARALPAGTRVLPAEAPALPAGAPAAR